MVSCSVVNKIKSHAALLKHLKVSSFAHDITFGKREISILADNKSLIDYYADTATPAVFTNEQGRTLAPGNYLDSKLEAMDKNYAALMNQAGSRLQYKRFFHMVEVEETCQHLFTFSFETIHDYEFQHVIVNNLGILKKFIEQHKENQKITITSAKKGDYRLLLPYSNEKVFKLNLKLSHREAECLKLTRMGKTAKQIGLELGISQRTVEEYLNNIKEKFNLKYKHELFELPENLMGNF